MAQIDEIKEDIAWAKDFFKILVAILVAVVAGMSKLYIDSNIGVLFYAAGIFSMVVGVSLIFIANDIKKKIRKLRDL